MQQHCNCSRGLVVEIFLKECTCALYFCIPLRARPNPNPGYKEEILEGPESAENVVKRNPAHLKRPDWPHADRSKVLAKYCSTAPRGKIQPK